MDTSIIAILVSVGSFIISGITAYFTKKNMQLTNALTLELQLMEAKKDWDIAIKDSEIALANSEQIDDGHLKKIATAIKAYNDSSVENYLNLFERLCFFILNKTFDEQQYKTQYRNMLNNTITSLSSLGKPFNNAANPTYKKMIELNNRWQNS